jgi:uncharacterized LabA/DUF88 family protein
MDPFSYTVDGCSVMMFVDGENLAIRYGAMLKSRGSPVAPTGWFLPGIGVWAQDLVHPRPTVQMIRKHFYTAVQGDEQKVSDVAEWLKTRGFEAPRVFKKEKGSRGSKQVDISLSTEMLLHGFRKHYDVAVLVAGDEDYVPLVRAVKSEGARVHVWFVSDGLSPKLRHEADEFVNLDGYFSV